MRLASVSYDQMTAVTDGGMRLRAVPLKVLLNGHPDWNSDPVRPGRPCFGCPLNPSPEDGGSVCQDPGPTAALCLGAGRKDGGCIVWREA